MKSEIEKILFSDSRLEKQKKHFEGLDELIECEKQLTLSLQNDPETLTLFEKYKTMSDDNGADDAIEFYKAGFRSGFWLAFELIKEDSEKSD